MTTLAISTWAEKTIHRLFESGGMKCHYCEGLTRLRVSPRQHRADDATVDHKVPKSAGGTNAPENLLLACRQCNEAKADRSYEDFIRRAMFHLANPTTSGMSGASP